MFIIIEVINELPLTVNPEVCGLNSNVLFGYHNNLVSLLWTNMIKLYPSVDIIDDKNTDWDKVVQNTTEGILKSLPELYNINKVKMFYGDKCFAPNIIVLLHELEKINALLEVIRNTLSQLSKVKTNICTYIYLFVENKYYIFIYFTLFFTQVFLGKVEMNSMLEEVSMCLYAGRVPGCWSKLSPPTVKSLADYIEHLTKRTLQYSNWVK